MIRCSVASARENSPVSRPSQSTRIRSLTVNSSGSSLDVTIIASPVAAKLVHQLYNSAFAPTSTPRVGSSSSSTSGRVSSQRPMMHFC